MADATTAPRVLVVDVAGAGQTLAAAVRRLDAELSWSAARTAIARGDVTVDGVRELDPVRRLAAGAKVALGGRRAASSASVWESGASRAPSAAAAGGATAAESAALAAPGSERQPGILVHVDRDLVVAAKPAGILTVPFAGDERDTLLDRLRVAVRRYEKAHGRAGSPALRTVQRLDKETSGLLVFARNVVTERALQAALADRTLERRYLALVHGWARPATHETLLLPDRGDGLRGSWRGRAGTEPPEARLALTEVEVVARYRAPAGAGAGAALSLVRCTLGSGRTHQIRIHLAESGHPLVGEPVYIRDFRGVRFPSSRLMLHAAELALTHPRTGQRLSFTRPPPDEFAAVLARLTVVASGESRDGVG